MQINTITEHMSEENSVNLSTQPRERQIIQKDSFGVVSAAAAKISNKALSYQRGDSKSSNGITGPPLLMHNDNSQHSNIQR